MAKLAGESTRIMHDHLLLSHLLLVKNLKQFGL